MPAPKVGRIDPSAVIERRSLLSDKTTVKARATVLGDVRTKGHVVIDSNTIIYGPVNLGEGSYVGPDCVLGFPTSDELSHMIRSGKFRRKLATKIGRNCILRPGTTIYSGVTLGDDVSFGHKALIREKVKIGNGTKIGTGVVIDGSCEIGKHVSIQTGVYICTHSTVEDCVFLGPCCVFTNDKYMMQKTAKLVGPRVKRGASIGANALLFPGVVVGEGAVVGSQAMVNRNVPPRTVFAGIPARKIKNVPRNWRSKLLRR